MSYNHQIDISDLSILLVEPSKMQSKVITQHLKEEGIVSIDSVHSGTEAINELAKYEPDLIISSMYLPDMTATELVVQVKTSEKYSNISFMLISSETRISALEPIRQAGVVAILPKPFNHAALKRALRNTIEFIDPEEISFEHYDIESVKVLLVDDSAMARKHIIRVLNNMGITQITEAKDGKEASDVFSWAEEEFDLVITDLNMPNMNGEELIHYIRTEMDNTFIPILMVTSEDNETRLNNVQQEGVSGILDKPFEPKTVKEMLFRVLDDV